MKLYSVATLIYAGKNKDILLDTYSILAQNEHEAYGAAAADLKAKYPDCQIKGIQTKEIPIQQMVHVVRDHYGDNLHLIKHMPAADSDSTAPTMPNAASKTQVFKPLDLSILKGKKPKGRGEPSPWEDE